MSKCGKKIPFSKNFGEFFLENKKFATQFFFQF
jgi:hypothetical protein